MTEMRKCSCPRARTVALVSSIIAAAFFVSLAAEAFAQARVVWLKIGPNQIGEVRTAQGISTRISFKEAVKEVICGDLYDPVSGAGSFVVQRIDNDVFIKAVTSKGASNMFVKAGEAGEYIYNFDLVIVPASQAYRIVHTVSAAADPPAVRPGPRPAAARPSVIARIAALGSRPEQLTSAVPNHLLITTWEGEKPAEPLVPVSINERSNYTPIGAATRQVPAVYPEYAKDIGPSGEVVVEVTVDETGKVSKARALSGHMLLRAAAVSAARKWRFEPALADGMAMEAVGQITFTFERFAKYGGNYIDPRWEVRRRRP